MTAVEWLVELIECGADLDQIKKCISKAKEMEKQQIIDAYSHGWHDGQDVIIKQVSHIDKGGDKAGEAYYNDMKGTDL